MNAKQESALPQADIRTSDALASAAIELAEAI